LFRLGRKSKDLNTLSLRVVGVEPTTNLHAWQSHLLVTLAFLSLAELGFEPNYDISYQNIYINKDFGTKKTAFGRLEMVGRW